MFLWHNQTRKIKKSCTDKPRQWCIQLRLHIGIAIALLQLPLSISSENNGWAQTFSFSLLSPSPHGLWVPFLNVPSECHWAHWPPVASVIKVFEIIFIILPRSCFPAGYKGMMARGRPCWRISSSRFFLCPPVEEEIAFLICPSPERIRGRDSLIFCVPGCCWM